MTVDQLEECQRLAIAAGWDEDTAARLLVRPQSETVTGFTAQLAQANAIRSLVQVLKPSIEAAGQDVEGAAEHFVARGFTYDRVRIDTAALMAEHDAATVINTARPLTTTTGDPYATRTAEIDARGKPRG